MKKTEIKNLDLTAYHEKLDNGLQIIIIPKSNVNNIYVTFSTKYGSNDIEFIPINEKKMKNTPLGIAHFLEHKLFEQSDGTDPFTFYSERGSDANANTNQKKTTYLFSGPDFVYENIEYLLNYVQSPYFTDKNVEKEKGIITQEIKMYQDDPDTILYESLMQNLFNEHPMKYPIIGDVESINSITKEDLFSCYNTFYHPSNMFVIVTGNVEPEKIVEIIRENQEKKKFLKTQIIRRKEYSENDKVTKKHEEISGNVAISKLAIAYKIRIKNLETLYQDLLYLLILFDVKFGATSLFVKKLFDENIINNNLEIDFDNTEQHIIIFISGTSKNSDILLEKIKDEINNKKIDKDEFERKKKTLLSSLIYMSDNIFSLNHSAMNDIIKYGKFNTERHNQTKNLNYHDFCELIKSVSFNNYSSFIINPKKES